MDQLKFSLSLTILVHTHTNTNNLKLKRKHLNSTTQGQCGKSEALPCKALFNTMMAAREGISWRIRQRTTWFGQCLPNDFVNALEVSVLWIKHIQTPFPEMCLSFLKEPQPRLLSPFQTWEPIVLRAKFSKSLEYLCKPTQLRHNLKTTSKQPPTGPQRLRTKKLLKLYGPALLWNAMSHHVITILKKYDMHLKCIFVTPTDHLNSKTQLSTRY